MSGNPDPLYVRARTALLAAAEALTDLLDAVVLLAAPAVHLHTRHAHFTAPEYTPDADFCVASADRSGNDRQSSFLSCSSGIRARTPALTAKRSATTIRIALDLPRWETTSAHQILRSVAQ